MKRLIIFTLVMLAVWSMETWWLNNRQPEISTTLALRQFDGTNSNAEKLRQFEASKDAATMIAFAISVLAAWMCFGREARAALNKIKARVLKATPLLVGMVCVAG